MSHSHSAPPSINTSAKVEAIGNALKEAGITLPEESKKPIIKVNGIEVTVP